MLLSDEIIIQSVIVYSENAIQVFYATKTDFIEQSIHTNVALAAFVTLYARLKLYSEMKKLGKRVLYCDTESLIFVSKPEIYVQELGSYLGEFTDEVDPGCYIRFCRAKKLCLQTE